MEVSFIFPLPYDGAVDSMTFMVDGKEYPAQLLNAKDARRVYEGYVRRNQDPALLEWMGTGMFKTSVFPVPPGAKRTVTMRYSQVCRKTYGLTEWLFPLSTAKYTSHPVEKVAVNVTLQSKVAIKNIYSPTHSVEIKRPSETSARIKFASTNQIPTSDFRLMYDVGDQAVGASVLSYRPNVNDEGYFLLLVSPDIKRRADKPLRKTVVFVVDRSGSMSGKKIEQAKGALNFVLNNLNEGDLFNIVAYDSTVESFRPELQRFSEQTRVEAQGFVSGIYSGGSTNIDGALKAALGQLKDDSMPSYVVFLTDGLPTAGERKESQIVANAKDSNSVRARVFSFGVGHDVNSRLLDKLSRTCFGQSQYVRPNEDIEEHVSRLYQRIGAPALVNLQLKFDLEGLSAADGSPVSRVYPKDAFDLFAGDQLVLVGRYKKPGNAKVTVTGTVDGKSQSFDFPAKMVDESLDDTHAFVEKLWAIRRVGEIIDEIDLKGNNQELINELVALATKHGILTPYTSFLADEMTNVRDLASVNRRAGVELEALRQTSGASAFGQRLAKSYLKRADRAPTSPAESLHYLGDASTTGPMGGGAGMGSGPGSPGMPGLARGRGQVGSGAPASDIPAVTHRTRNVGKKTFFWRNKRWEDSVLTDAQLKGLKEVKLYSDEYFDLVSRHGKDVAKYLATDDNIVVVLAGKAYAFLKE
jgi:Ca-activated chloride channel family protein